jgi:hypothetical protein
MAQDKQTMQYGLWPSPIGPQSLAEGLRLSDVVWDSDGETLIWLEGRSDRGVLVCLPPGGDAPRDLTPELSVRARVDTAAEILAWSVGTCISWKPGAACIVNP